MRKPSLSLASRIRGEVEDLERIVERTLRSWTAYRPGDATAEAYLDSVAFNLHGLYSGIERLTELILRSIDAAVPSGEAWHRDLLRQTGAEIPGIRPAVFGTESLVLLDELRRFRHVARNVYATNLIPTRIEQLVISLRSGWPGVQKELLAFATWLERL